MPHVLINPRKAVTSVGDYSLFPRLSFDIFECISIRNNRDYILEKNHTKTGESNICAK